MPDAFDVQDCLQRVRDGDAAAAHALITHLHPLVRRLVRNHLPRRESEEDLMQEVFVKLFQKLDSYRERSGIPFEHWLSRLTVRTCLDALRAEKTRPEWRFADFSEGETEWLDYLLNRQAEVPAQSGSDAHALVTRLLALLSPPDRLVLTLLDLEERSTQEISQLTGWTRPMVKMRAMRARHKLRALARQTLKSEFPNP
ncbi:RNA polymerase sigma factor [Prosthecobacter sp. SYSU 5D2]|uniref:RNA polymerase sigma factor n=1 Tax=Prosthecobacter sp. SYSU 5D2 TaxID=3134134 RepID=UPI0031FF0103